MIRSTALFLLLALPRDCSSGQSGPLLVGSSTYISLWMKGSHLNFYTRHKWRKYLLRCANSRDGYLQVLVQCSDYMIWGRENCSGNVKTSFFPEQLYLFIP